MLKRILITGLSMFAGLLLVAAAPNAASCADMNFEGTFENDKLDNGRWYLKQIHQPFIQQDIVRSGAHALMLSGKREFTCRPDSAPGNCMRNQIRLYRKYHLPAGTPAWYGFSLRVEGRVPRQGSIRTVLAEWKEHGGASPFAALRYDNGVFHLSVQDNRCRSLVTMGWEQADAVGISTVPADIKRNCRDRLNITAARPLPDPHGRWVDLAVFIKRDRVHGVVEVWADGKFIGRVTGPIGNDAHTRCGDDLRCLDRTDPTQYFKAGIYADVCTYVRSENAGEDQAFCREGELAIYLDNIRRGNSRSDVDPTLIDPKT